MNQEPKLDATGKGLPFLESLIMKFYVGPVLSKRDSAEKNFKRFERLNEKILLSVQELPLENIHRRVLVPPLQGIEDSSRLWSVAETLEHIEIVGQSIAGAIETLAHGEVPKGKVDIASYKPKGKYASQDPRPHFQSFHKRVCERLKPLSITNAGPTLYHPWLGNLSALQWLWLLSSHSGIHHNQIKHILMGL